MSFINPIELLGLQDIPAEAIDSALLRRTRRKLQAEIELSDEGHIAYKGKNLSRSECEAAIAQLEIAEKIGHFHLVARYPALSDFLTIGDPAVFESFPQANELRRPGFLAFVSAAFAVQYDKALWDALRTKNGRLFQRIITTPPLVKPEDMDAAHRQLVRHLKDNIGEVEKENKAIDREESQFDEDTAKEAAAWVKGKLNAKVFVLLPSALQSLRNEGAKAVRNFAISINNELDDPACALELVEYAQSMKPDGLTRQQLTEDFTAVKKLAEARQETERLAPMLEKYGGIMAAIVQKVNELDNQTATVASIENWVNSNISVAELNGLPVELQEVRNQVALGLRGLSVAVWNKYQNLEAAIRLIEKAEILQTFDETRQNIKAAKEQLYALKSKVDTHRNTSFTSNRHSSSQKKTSNVFWTDYAVVGVILAFFLLVACLSIFKKEPEPIPFTTERVPSYSPSDLIPDKVESSSEPAKDYAPKRLNIPEQIKHNEELLKQFPKISQHQGNQLKNGSSPFDACFGKGRYSGGKAFITFENNNTSDAIVCLIDISSGRTIRNEYIRKGESFKMSQIPAGTYTMKVYHGNDWNPTLKNFCGTLGAFESDVHFSKSDNPDDYLTINDGNGSYTTGTVTLYTVANGNMQQEASSEAEFFSN